MAEESFPLPGSSYKQLEKIISAYAELKSEAGPAGVATLAGTDSTNVSRNNKFLVATGVVEGTLKKRVTAFGEKLGRSIHYSQAETEKECWLEMVEKNEFFQKIISAVRIRRGMDSATLTNHIAFSAGAPRNGQMMAGAGAVLEILVRSGALVEQGGVLVAPLGPSPSKIDKEPAVTSQPLSEYLNASLYQPLSPSGSLFLEPKTTVTRRELNKEVTVQIEVQVACTPSDLESLGPKLRRLLSDINSPEAGKQVTPPKDDAGGE